MNVLPNVGSFPPILRGLLPISGQLRDATERHRITIHITINRRSQILLLPSARNSLLHRVLHVRLPVKHSSSPRIRHTNRSCVRRFPLLVFPLQVRHHPRDPVLAPVHQIPSPQRMSRPRRVVPDLLHRSPLMPVIPRPDNLVQVRRIPQPTAFMYMMTERARNQVILISVAPRNQKLRHGPSYGRPSDMFPQRPPSVVPHLLETAVRTIEQRHVPHHPVPRFRIGYRLHDVLRLHAVEIVYVMFIIPISQKRGPVADGLPIGINLFSPHSRNTVARLRFFITGMLQGPVPIGRRVHVGLPSFTPRPEHHALNGFNRRKQHPLTGFPSVHIHLDHAARNAHPRLDVVHPSGLVSS